MPTTLISAGADRFVRAEVDPFHMAVSTFLHDHDGVAVAGIGTTAPKAVHGALLAEAIKAAGYTIKTATPLGGPAELAADPSWQLGVVLSPWKREVGQHCDRLAPSAELTGVVDTVVRASAGTVGFNTNTWAALSALEVLSGGAEPRRILILGAGASARSVALAAQRAWPDCQLVIAARSPAAAQALAEQFPGTLVDRTSAYGGPDGARTDIVVNTTTWGETEASEVEPLGIALDGFLSPGARLFDLNNRIGALPVRALEAGCVVVSGSVMQRVTNACRAALLAYATLGGQSERTTP